MRVPSSLATTVDSNSMPITSCKSITKRSQLNVTFLEVQLLDRLFDHLQLSAVTVRATTTMVAFHNFGCA